MGGNQVRRLFGLEKGRSRAYLEPMTLQFPFEHTYAALPANFFARVAPTPVAAPRLIKLNRELAIQLGLDPDQLATPEGAEILSGKRLPEGAEPIAMAYAGHQFGQFVPQFGDGRAILLGEVIDKDGIRCDIQLKGSGPTPFSRRGDGRAALGPVLREYIVSEAMFRLGIPTTRSLAAVMSGESVMRETMLPGAVLTRVAASHIRVGTFQFFAARGDTDGVRRLADHAIGRHYPELAKAERPYHALLDTVIARQAGLVARWLLVGFIQPRRALWNLTRFAECLLPLFSDDQDKAIEQAQFALGEFAEKFTAAYQAGLRAKIGLFTQRDGDEALVQDLLDAMTRNQADFTLTFRRLGEAALGPDNDEPVRGLFIDPTMFDGWAARWRQRTALEPQSPEERRTAMQRVNPAFIPRNHRVEAVIQAAMNNDDYAPFEELLTVLSKPFEEQPSFAGYAEPPEADQRVTQTFCGT